MWNRKKVTGETEIKTITGETNRKVIPGETEQTVKTIAGEIEKESLVKQKNGHWWYRKLIADETEKR